MSLKIVAISDTHGMHQSVKIPPGDVLIHCGDFTKYGRSSEVKEFVKWLGRQPHKHKIFTAGNHDEAAQHQILKCRGFAEKQDNVHFLIDETVTIEGIKFYGSPWTPRFFEWHYMKQRGAPLKEVWDRIPEDTDVLITHGPPYGHGDLAPAYRTPNPKVAGCLDLLNRVRIVRPKLHFFGHIHDGYGQTDSDEFKLTTFVNASTCNERYEPINPPQVCTL